MPISEKILTEVKKTKATDAEKKLMLEILQIEDKGSYRFQKEYDAIVKKYITINEEVNNGHSH